MSKRHIAGRPPPRLQGWFEHLGFRIMRRRFEPLGLWRAGNWAGWCGRAIGSRLWFMRRARQAIDHVRPDADAALRRRIYRGCLDCFARTMVGYLHLAELFGGEAAEIEVEGLENLLAAQQAAGGRVIFATAHFGNWEGVRAIAARHGQAPAIIYRALNNREVDAECFELLTSMGWPAFRKGRQGGRDLFRHVREGGSAMILVDHRMGGAPILDFMGKPAETSIAAAQLARKFEAPLITACARWTPRGLKVLFEPPVRPDDPVRMMQDVNDRIGAWIDAWPEQWLWLHRRWRIRNVGDRVRKFEATGGRDPVEG